MVQASYSQNSFLGGFWSKFAQGQFSQQELPAYRTAMNVCLNGFPIEPGAWQRRPGTALGGTTRSGAKGRGIKFDVAQAVPYVFEFTDAHLRFWQGTQVQYTDTATIASISATNPAVVNTGTPTTWSTGDQAQLGSLGTSIPLLQNRTLSLTKIDTTHFSLTDAITGTTIDGSTLGVGALAAGATISRIIDLATPYTSGSWATVHSVQAQATSILLGGNTAPQFLQAPGVPSNLFGMGFTLGPLVLLDGPYLDLFQNGAQINPGTLTGVVTMTVTFQAYSASVVYTIGDYVVSGGINYVSLIDSNIANTPVSSPSAWAATSAGAAINNGQGFLGTDIGRSIRLLSEPPPWVAATAYSAGQVISYNPTGEPGAEAFYQAAVNNTGHTPGTDLTNWTLLPASAALWTWGKIISLANLIVPNGGPVVGHIGNMGNNGGLAASFDSVPSKTGILSSQFATNATSADAYVGQNYTGTPQKIGSATLYPSTDFGFAVFFYNGGINQTSPPVTINLRGKASAPASPADGTLLGSISGPNTFQPITIVSNDQATTWNFVWFEIIGQPQVGFPGFPTYVLLSSQAEFFNPTGTGGGTAVNVELLGPNLLYTTPIISWQLGAYSNTTGWPTTGAYEDGRLWLAGSTGNRFYASVANGLVGNTVNFAPTNQYGVVGQANSIAETINSDGVNPIFWFMPDQQGMLMGTQAGEFLVFAPGQGGLSPLNIDVRRVTRLGVANIEPRRTEHTVTFVQRYARKIMEYFSDVFSGKFTAPNLSKNAKSVTKSGIQEIAYQQELAPILWERNTDGSLAGITYKRDTLMTSQGPTFYGWHVHTLGTGRLVESLTVGPSVDGTLDALSIVTNDPTTNIRFFEVLTNIADEGNTLQQSWYVDAGIVPSSYVVQVAGFAGSAYGGVTLNGLWLHNGKTVSAWLGGLDTGDYVVSNGSIFVPFGDGFGGIPTSSVNRTDQGLYTRAWLNANSQMVVGFSFTSQGQIVRPAGQAESGSRQGPSLGDPRHHHRAAFLLADTGLGMQWGTNFGNMSLMNFVGVDGQTVLGPNQLFNGVYMDNIPDDHTLDSMIAWRIVRPYPATVVAISGKLVTEDV